MIQIENKSKCCGCFACYSICPRNAIIMTSDEEGFLYPIVNKDVCIECGLCEKVCPINKIKEADNKTRGYIIRNKDEKIVKDSTSGGAFTAIASYFIERGAVVYGAGYDENMQVVHKKVETLRDLAALRGSKFVQSLIGEVYREVKLDLSQGKQVLFSGTPCQISGLSSFLGKKFDNLFCVDFVCRGVPSPMLWSNYIAMMESKYQSRIIGAKFKNKTYGYHATTMKIDFENGKSYFASGRVDPMMKSFVREMASRPSCSECSFKGISRVSDITMFDCYEYEKITGMKDDDKGYSSLFVHTDRGVSLLEQISDKISILPVEVDKLVTKNGIMVCNSAKQSPLRSEFYRLAASEPIDVAMQRVNPITTKDKIIEKIKSILFKIGIIRFAKKFKKREVIHTSK